MANGRVGGRGSERMNGRIGGRAGRLTVVSAGRRAGWTVNIPNIILNNNYIIGPSNIVSVDIRKSIPHYSRLQVS